MTRKHFRDLAEALARTRPLFPEDRGTWFSTFHPFADHDRFAAIVDRCLKALEPIRDQFDIVVVRGASGITVGSVVAYLMGKQLTVVRKPGEASHVFHRFSGELIPDRSVFLDDFMESGTTYEQVVVVLKAPPRFVMLYANTPFQGTVGPSSYKLNHIGGNTWATTPLLPSTGGQVEPTS